MEVRFPPKMLPMPDNVFGESADAATSTDGELSGGKSPANKGEPFTLEISTSSEGDYASGSV